MISPPILIRQVDYMGFSEKIQRKEIRMIYENVVELAKKKKMTLSEVEKQSGISKGVISKWKTVSPNIDSLQAVAKTLGVTVNRLLK